MFCFKRLHVTCKKTVFLLSTSAIVTVPAVTNAETIKAVRDKQLEIHDTETGWDRLLRMYSRNEYGQLSMELSAVLHSTYLSFFCGAIYGVCQNTRVAYRNFIEKNQASQFANAFEARRLLQDRVMLAGFKGFFKYGVKLSLFTGAMLAGTITMLVYSGSSSIFHYAISGTVFGTLYRWKLGPQGMLVGGTLGFTLGLFAGMSAKGLFMLTGSKLDDILLYNEQLYNQRTKSYREAYMKRLEETSVDEDVITLVREHDFKKGAKKSLEDEPVSKEIATATVSNKSVSN